MINDTTYDRMGFEVDDCVAAFMTSDSMENFDLLVDSAHIDDGDSEYLVLLTMMLWSLDGFMG